MTRVLVLNSDYRPVNVCSVQRAVVLLLKQKAEAVEVDEDELRAERTSIPRPVVVRLITYVRIPNAARKRLTRRAVFARDGYACLYCGATAPLTVDHIRPRALGGKHTWENVATSCMRCNQHKGHATLRESGMKLRQKPHTPRRDVFVFIHVKVPPQSWMTYLGK